MQHHSTLAPYFPENLQDYALWVSTHGLLAPYGKCQCGCGQSVRAATQDDLHNGYLKGMSVRFIRGHGRRVQYLSVEDLFYHHTTTGEPNACWEWQGSLDSDGYGQLKFKGRSYKAHRLSYTIHLGAIARGLLVCHECDNPKCVNPNHLWLGTTLDNNRDAIEKGRRNPARGENNGGAKLNTASVMAIREEVRQGITQLAIAQKYGVSRALVSMVAKRKVWAHVE